MVMTVLAPIGGLEAALVPLCRQLKGQCHETLVFAIEPFSRLNQNFEALREANIAVFTSPQWVVRLAKLGISKRAQLLRAMIIEPLSLSDHCYRKCPDKTTFAPSILGWHRWQSAEFVHDG
jgi:hypothetical protein